MVSDSDCIGQRVHLLPIVHLIVHLIEGRVDISPSHRRDRPSHLVPSGSSRHSSPVFPYSPPAALMIIDDCLQPALGFLWTVLRRHLEGACNQMMKIKESGQAENTDEVASPIPRQGSPPTNVGSRGCQRKGERLWRVKLQIHECLESRTGKVKFGRVGSWGASPSEALLKSRLFVGFRRSLTQQSSLKTAFVMEIGARRR